MRAKHELGNCGEIELHKEPRRARGCGERAAVEGYSADGVDAEEECGDWCRESTVEVRKEAFASYRRHARVKHWMYDCAGRNCCSRRVQVRRVRVANGYVMAATEPPTASNHPDTRLHFKATTTTSNISIREVFSELMPSCEAPVGAVLVMSDTMYSLFLLMKLNSTWIGPPRIATESSLVPGTA